ncbi:formate dehydrogenase major subunit [Cupriavidus plantarum]|nr:formate dehydrogenase major subunit [Cupriavidus plantarum]REE93415.1 formate dehydrogenase (quinone-dependent) catalytic subunit [Cupriavidus plantarum]RLK38847.1 formate dehydrogenase (quinone-dependent) catalytic subunit [Cupriavidus plantarum]CAG2136900.1 Formate dehydrogenase-O major subunit [Cupriavidus plantarum]
MTNHWVDIKNADVILIMGGNAAEAHPCGFKWVTEAKAHNKARLIVVDPRFTRSASIADYYVPIRTGTDIAFLGGVINYLLTNDKIQHEYVKSYTDFSFIVREDFKFEDGIFSGYDAEKRFYDKSTWEYERGEDGYVKTDPTLAHPRCVYQLMKAHYARYTPEVVEKICGSPKDKFLKVCEMMASTATPTRAMTIMYALGWTQHSIGSQNVRSGAMVQLLLGNIGVAGGGMNALRGHSNIQGLTDLGLLSNSLPGYLTLPGEAEQDYQKYIEARSPKPLRPNQLSYWQNYPKFHVSLMKAWWGNAATAENNWAYDYLPKLDKPYDMLQMYELMTQGKINGYIAQGFNPLAAAPNKNKLLRAFSNLKFMIVMDPLATETSEFWRNAGESNDVDPKKIQTEVFRLPTTCFAEENGALVNSSRWLQWHWQGADPPGEARSDIEIMSDIWLRMRKMYQTDGGKYPDPIVNLAWPYAVPHSPTPDELAKEYSGRAITDLVDPKDPTKVIRKAGEQLDSFGQLQADGSTSSGCWIYCGAWTQAGNQMAKRDTADPTGIGQTLNWAWSWPANRRVLYNRASCDVNGKPFNPDRKLIAWNGKSWTGFDTPDYKLDEDPASGMGPFIMQPEGVARFFARGNMVEGPFPEHYEPFENPLGYNVLHKNKQAVSNPAARVFKDDWQQFGKADAFPHMATTYRLTEHFHFWTKHARINAVLQPEQFVEIGEDLARQVGVKAGDRVKVSSARGYIKAVALVTKRIKPFAIDGKTVHMVGVPLHWGFTGLTKPGFITNTLTPYVGDGNTQTPEFKSFMVKVERA